MAIFNSHVSLPEGISWKEISWAFFYQKLIIWGNLTLAIGPLLGLSYDQFDISTINPMDFSHFFATVHAMFTAELHSY